jgi:hypothetical protein
LGIYSGAVTQQATPAAQSEQEKRQEYERCFQRWLNMNGQVWQVPALAMTAQAFLFTIMLSPETGQWPRVLSAALAFVVSFMSVHLIRKHRHHQSLDYGRMIELEEELGMTMSFAQSAWRDDPAWAGEIRKKLTGDRELQLYEQNRSSVDVWVWGFWIFAVAAVFVAVATFAAPGMYAKWEPPTSTPDQQGQTTSTATPTATSTPSQATPAPSATTKPRTTP